MIIDTLMTRWSVDGLYQSFTVNAAVTGVAPNALPAHAGAYCPLVNPNTSGNYRCFQPKDSVQVISCGVWFPYSFGLGNTPLYLRLWWGDDTRTHFQPCAEFSSAGMVILPAENAEHVQNVLLAWPALTGKAGLMAEVFDPGAGGFWPVYTALSISMINAPSSLNGTTMYIFPWVKVQHTLPMTTGQ